MPEGTDALCPMCKGTGQCPWCAGIGVTETAGVSTPCTRCAHPGDTMSGQKGDGQCVACQGTGIHP